MEQQKHVQFDIDELRDNPNDMQEEMNQEHIQMLIPEKGSG